MTRRSPLLLVGLGLLAGILLLVLFGGISGNSLKNRVQDLFGYGGEHSDDPAHGRDLFHTGADIGGSKGGMTYAIFDRQRDTVAIEGFQGFGCIGTCRELERGYRWAANKRVAKASGCMGPSWAFLEGCAAYATEARERQ